MTRKGVVDRVAVHRGDERAGLLERTTRGARFSYDASYLDAHRSDRGPLGGAVALHLPLSPEPHEVAGTNLHPFFAGLLPEGARYAALLRAVKTSPEDLLSLLAAAGRDCIGDVAVVHEDESPGNPRPTLDLEDIANASFQELFEASLDYGGSAEQLTAPGVQAKISAAMISLPVEGVTGGAYLLKLEPKEYPRIVQNEAFMMGLAHEAGITTADVRVVEDRKGAPGLLVRRFDRTTVKLHVEDCCQLLDRYPADKYAVSMSDLAGALARYGSIPILDVAMLVRLTAFSYVIANGDLHAKNVSLLLSEDRTTLSLSPAYDLLTTLPYGDETMALPLDGRDKRLRRSQLVDFATRFGVRPPATHALLDEICDAVLARTDRLGEIGLTERKTAHLERVIRKRCDDLE
jgi:serine/threonine-protein kinase HipA